MNKITTFFLLLISNIIFAQNADDIIGKYHLPNNLDVELYKQGDVYFGKIIALNGCDNGQTMDVKNPEESKRSDLLIGKIIIKDLRFDKEERQWLDGKMYGPEKGIFFNLKVTNINKKEIVIVGSKFLFWRTLIWNKI